MKIVTDITHDQNATLVIGNLESALIKNLITYLKSKSVVVYATSHMPPEIPTNINRFFCFTDILSIPSDIKKYAHFPQVFLIASVKNTPDHRYEAKMISFLKNYPNIKVALIPRGKHDIDHIVISLLRFVFDESDCYRFITSESHAADTPALSPVGPSSTNDGLMTWMLHHPKKSIAIAISAVIAVHTIFLLLILSSTIIYLAGQISKSKIYLRFFSPTDIYRKSAMSLFTLSHNVYTPFKRGWQFIGLSSPIDRFYSAVFALIEIDIETKQARNDSGILIARILDPNSVDFDQISQKKDQLAKTISKIDKNLITLESNIPRILEQRLKLSTTILKSKEYLSIANTFFERFDLIMGKDSPKTYAIFFGNNHELRPGGGFIGSFALVKFHKLKLTEMKIYDVYDADGQLKARVAPPEPISRYLGQPFFFLRDSAFTADFPTNTLTAEDFINKELGVSSIDGAFMLTFSAIEQIIGAIGPIYIPDYQTQVDYENVYYKMQKYIEEDSFPGSTRKKDFIDSLVAEIMQRLSEPKDAVKILLTLRSSFDRKFASAYFKDDTLQSILDKYHWSGRQLSPDCIGVDSIQKDTCVANYIYPVEANLGVNKANAFMKRHYTLSTKVLSDGTIESVFEVYFINESKKNIFPGGLYKNYYQLYLPPKTQILSLTIDDSITSKYETEESNYTRFAYLLEIPESTKRKLRLVYRLDRKLSRRVSTLQTIIQKQIGLPDSAIQLRFGLRDQHKIISSNFSPLAYGDVFEYNSAIDSDKIYYFNLK
jgi:hypothetical protein